MRMKQRMMMDKKKMKKNKCFYCKKQGHYIRDCAEKKKDSKKRTWDVAVASNDPSNYEYYSADLLMASNNNLRGHGSLTQGVPFICVLIEVYFII